uniref:Uncharacterized protein n=1 Tax=Cacopsylla melanoneura TaxID=428564 RepID=A0A8D8LQU6_9HEMI
MREVICSLMIADTHHVWKIGRNRLNLIHELVSHSPIIPVHIIRKVTHMQNSIVFMILRFFLKSRQTLSIHIAHVTIHGQLGNIGWTRIHCIEPELIRPAEVRPTVVDVFSLWFEAGQSDTVNVLFAFV